MGKLTLQDIKIFPLIKVSTVGGDILHGLKKTDSGFDGFGEAYFSQIHKGSIKAWKQHKLMTMNLIVPIGTIRFVFFLNGEYREEKIGTNNYARVVVPPGIWFGFQGIESADNLLLNIANIPHDPTEASRLPLENITYSWGAL